MDFLFYNLVTAYHVKVHSLPGEFSRNNLKLFWNVWPPAGTLLWWLFLPTKEGLLLDAFILIWHFIILAQEYFLQHKFKVFDVITKAGKMIMYLKFIVFTFNRNHSLSEFLCCLYLLFPYLPSLLSSLRLESDLPLW